MLPYNPYKQNEYNIILKGNERRMAIIPPRIRHNYLLLSTQINPTLSFTATSVMGINVNVYKRNLYYVLYIEAML